jgi:hypothetical protein
MQALFIIAFIFSVQFVFAQPAPDLDPEKWVVELSKKDRSAYSSLNSLTVKLQGLDSVKVIQFLDKLAEEGKSKGDHFKQFFYCCPS